MFARANAGHHQIAYVTNDLDRCIAMFKRDYDVPAFFVFSNVDTGVAKDGDPQLRIALANVGGVEIELIEPIGDTAPLYRDALTDGAAFDVRFHHTAIRVGGSLQDWRDYLDSIDTRTHPIVLKGQFGEDLRYIYTDERQLGHYIEHVWMSPALLSQMRVAIPRTPAAEPPP
jgi:hypothetical protein